jgi:hypothetical protein
MNEQIISEDRLTIKHGNQTLADLEDSGNGMEAEIFEGDKHRNCRELERKLKIAEEALVRVEDLRPIYERERRKIARDALDAIREKA